MDVNGHQSSAAASSGPPPKPWERAGSTSGPAPFKPASPGTTSDVVEASGTSKPGEIVSASHRNVAMSTSSVGRVLPTRPWENSYGSSTYGGYNSGSGIGLGLYNSYGQGYGGMYGGGMFGNSLYRGGYGGGMYGNSLGGYGGGMYGNSLGGYGGSMYGNNFGGPLGGYGMGIGGPLGGQDPNNPYGHGDPSSPPGFWISFLRVMQGVVSFFGRISILVDQNTQAVHLFMSTLLQLFDRGGVLYGELARFVMRLLGVKAKPERMQHLGPNGGGTQLPGLPSREQRLIEGPKPVSGESWDKVWGTTR